MASGKLPYPTRRIREGKAEIIVPDPSAYRRKDGVYEPAWAPVFYNPKMRFNRDIAILVANAYREMISQERLVVAEPLAGSGVRAIRYALEADAQVYAADIDPDAVYLARLNVEVNGVQERVTVERADANEYLAKLRREGVKLSIIDIDPFGSPAPFLDTAIQSISVRGMIAATATDTAPLSGTHPRALRRRYGVQPARTAWEKEQAVRLLAGYIIRRAASHEYGVRILLAYYADYYVRVYAELWRGASRADDSLSKLGYGVYCPYCGYTGYTDNPRTRCPYCGGTMQIVGPLYTGPLCNQEFMEMLRSTLDKKVSSLAEPKRVVRLFEQLSLECTVTKPYYRLDKLCSILHMNMPKPDSIVEALRRKGYKAARTHFDPRGFRTNAPHTEVLNTLIEMQTRIAGEGNSD